MSPVLTSFRMTVPPEPLLLLTKCACYILAETRSFHLICHMFGLRSGVAEGGGAELGVGLKVAQYNR